MVLAPDDVSNGDCVEERLLASEALQRRDAALEKVQLFSGCGAGPVHGELDPDNRYYHRYLAPALVRLALALDERAIARRVSNVANARAALALEVPSVQSVQSAAHRCRGLVDDDPDAMLAQSTSPAEPAGGRSRRGL